MSKILEKNEVLTLGFGNQTLNGQPYNHTGIDIVGEGMTACHVKALMSGHVVDKGYQENGYGNYIVIDHENGYETRYAHLADPADVNIGDHVEEGQIFGYMGATGYAFGVHLHFEILSGDLGFRVIDPTDYIFGNAKLPDNKSKNNHKYSIGQKVRFSTCYVSAYTTPGFDNCIYANQMIKDTGVITRIEENSYNPYLLDNGMCWVNDGDIREVL